MKPLLSTPNHGIDASGTPTSRRFRQNRPPRETRGVVLQRRIPLSTSSVMGRRYST